MKQLVWFCLAGLGLVGRGQAQNLAGAWQGVEFNPGSAASEYWPAVLTLRAGQGTALTGELYQVAGSLPTVTGTFAMRGTRTATGLRISHVKVLAETNPDGGNWCFGTIVFAYNAAQEKLVGRSAYTAEGCHGGTAEFYRVVLKSAAAVPRGVPSVLRVSGRNVRWFADAALRRPLASGNTYRARLGKTTTFYLTQGFYTTDRSPVVPVTVRATGPLLGATPATPATPPPPAAEPPVAQRADTLVVCRRLPSVQFKVATAELLPGAAPALDTLAAAMRRFPALRFRIEGHTDRLGEVSKNRTLSLQRALAVKDFLVKAGISPARLETVGYGDDRPIFVAPNPGNRRVEVWPIPTPR